MTRIANLSDAQKEELVPLIETKPSGAVAAPVANRPFVKSWTLEELIPLVNNGLKGRDFDRGHSLFAATRCFSCHRFSDEGGGLGPDLSGLAGRFNVRDLLESIVVPSKVISDQYEARDDHDRRRPHRDRPDRESERREHDDQPRHARSQHDGLRKAG